MTEHAIGIDAHARGAHQRRSQTVALLATGAIAVTAALGVVAWPGARPFANRVMRSQAAALYVSPIFWLVIAGTLLLERLAPARRQAVFSRSLRTDASYVVITHAAG